mmetsp:Transcript_7929/g.11974  ORF Transcript_7929/g.11974 Transcript_7929/m.11974 type:complete len:479 (-) Transcript_7929:113-1549(-)
MKMFRESANFEKAEADDNANMLPLAMNSRNLHSLFNDAHGNLRMGNSTTDHYHRPAAGGGSPSTTDQGAKATTTDDDTTLGQTDNQTLSFTLIFLSLMVVYIGFCCHYRKVKVRRSYDDSAHSQNANNNRQRRQRNNQAVLDESSSAANRAAADSEEQRKLEERKVRIGEVLWTRLIVDDEDEVVEKGGHGASVNGGGDEEENQVNANYDKIHEKSDLVDEEMGNEDAAAVVEGKTLAQDEDATAAAAATLATKQEDEEAPSFEETTIATVPSSSEETITTIPSNEAVPTIGTSPSSSTAVAPSTPPSSPFRKYADALSCNNCHHHATNYCNNHHINCNNDAAASSSPANNKSSNNSSLTTITLSDIQQTYGDECNICLSTFQVGDRAAWSKHHFNGCIHVFHDECMKRWLLVRDGCPICRRLYLGEGTMTKGLVPTPQDEDGGANDGANDDGEEESGRDLESGGGGMGNAIITVEEE